MSTPKKFAPESILFCSKEELVSLKVKFPPQLSTRHKECSSDNPAKKFASKF